MVGDDADYVLNSSTVQVQSRQPAIVEISFWPDDIALENDEELILSLVPVDARSALEGRLSWFLERDIRLTILDSDCKSIHSRSVV